MADIYKSDTYNFAGKNLIVDRVTELHGNTRSLINSNSMFVKSSSHKESDTITRTLYQIGARPGQDPEDGKWYIDIFAFNSLLPSTSDYSSEYYTEVGYVNCSGRSLPVSTKMGEKYMRFKPDRVGTWAICIYKDNPMEEALTPHILWLTPQDEQMKWVPPGVEWPQKSEDGKVDVNVYAYDGFWIIGDFACKEVTEGHYEGFNLSPIHDGLTPQKFMINQFMEIISNADGEQDGKTIEDFSEWAKALGCEQIFKRLAVMQLFTKEIFAHKISTDELIASSISHAALKTIDASVGWTSLGNLQDKHDTWKNCTDTTSNGVLRKTMWDITKLIPTARAKLIESARNGVDPSYEGATLDGKKIKRVCVTTSDREDHDEINTGQANYNTTVRTKEFTKEGKLPKYKNVAKATGAFFGKQQYLFTLINTYGRPIFVKGTCSNSARIISEVYIEVGGVRYPDETSVDMILMPNEEMKIYVSVGWGSATMTSTAECNLSYGYAETIQPVKFGGIKISAPSSMEYKHIGTINLPIKSRYIGINYHGDNPSEKIYRKDGESYKLLTEISNSRYFLILDLRDNLTGNVELYCGSDESVNIDRFVCTAYQSLDKSEMVIYTEDDVGHKFSPNGLQNRFVSENIQNLFGFTSEFTHYSATDVYSAMVNHFYEIKDGKAEKVNLGTGSFLLGVYQERNDQNNAIGQPFPSRVAFIQDITKPEDLTKATLLKSKGGEGSYEKNLRDLTYMVIANDYIEFQSKDGAYVRFYNGNREGKNVDTQNLLRSAIPDVEFLLTLMTNPLSIRTAHIIPLEGGVYDIGQQNNRYNLGYFDDIDINNALLVGVTNSGGANKGDIKGKAIYADTSLATPVINIGDVFEFKNNGKVIMRITPKKA